MHCARSMGLTNTQSRRLPCKGLLLWPLAATFSTRTGLSQLAAARHNLSNHLFLSRMKKKPRKEIMLLLAVHPMIATDCRGQTARGSQRGWRCGSTSSFRPAVGLAASKLAPGKLHRDQAYRERGPRPLVKWGKNVDFPPRPSHHPNASPLLIHLDLHRP